MNFKISFTLFLILVISSCIYSQADTLNWNYANRLLNDKKYSEAKIVFTRLLKNEPDNSNAWFYLGVSEYYLKNYKEAITAYKKATEKFQGPTVCYNLAGVYALSGDKKSAYLWLDKALKRGFSQFNVIANDSDFLSLQGDKQFKEILEKVKIRSNPCLAREEYNQFNFWIGKWDVVNPAGKHAGDSEIDLMNKGCTIVENWYGAGGFVGKSFNYFDTSDNKWHQFWINQNAQKTTYEGKLENGNMVFYSYDHLNDNKDPFIRRLTFFNLGPDKVRQFSEKSTDNGKSWITEYDFIYNRKTNSD